jgi:pectin methylesterase-like acyl-CoA thioesterase
MHHRQIGSRKRADTTGRRALGRAIGTAAVAFLVASSPVAPRPASGLAAASASGKQSHVLLVGTWHGHTGQFRSIQAAVNAARPGDWILVVPGDYHESPTAAVGVRITTPNLHLVGLDRNTVVVDGDRPGAPSACDPTPRWQNPTRWLVSSCSRPSCRPT